MGINCYKGVLPTDSIDGIRVPGAGDNERTWPVTTTIAPASEAFEYGVVTGDVIVALEGNWLASFEDFSSVIGAIGRPVRITFLRRSTDDGSETNQIKDGNSKAADLSQQSNTNSASDQQQREQERERRAAAAAQRASAWDKKLGSSKIGKKETRASPAVSQNQDSSPQADMSEETKRAIICAKANEAHIAKQLGYSPFQPHMSFSAAASTTVSAESNPDITNNNGNEDKSTTNSASTPSVQPDIVAAAEVTVNVEQSSIPIDAAENLSSEELAETESAVDDALAMLLSLGESQQNAAEVTARTVLKMLTNLRANAQTNPKLRSIRIGNEAFQSKVACVPGGVELLQASGYSIDNNSEESYLVHDMKIKTQQKLDYTISRLNEVLQDSGLRI